MIKKWKIAPANSGDSLHGVLHPILHQVLINRGFKDEDIEEFLSENWQKYENDPFLFKEMSTAVEVIINSIKAGEKIVVYGDYDADGVTATSLMFEVLNLLKAKAEVYIPDRVKEGYGLNRSAINTILGTGAKLIITVDGGIRSAEEVDYAVSCGAKVIITDHHLPPEKDMTVKSAPVINPAVGKETYPFKFLAGVGVAFKVAQAIISRSKLPDDLKIKIEERLLDLVCIGTIADMVVLTGENRHLIKRGLKSLSQTKRAGLIELFNVAGLKKDKQQLEAWNVGFQIGPRINAAGRMGHANNAFELLTTTDKIEAKSLARRLNERNAERQQDTDRIVDEIMVQVGNKTDDYIICAVDTRKSEDSWNEGIIGLAAGRISEFFYRPCLVITRAEEGFKGSGRSIPGFDITEAMEHCRAYLGKYGGHPSACGFSFEEDQLNVFIVCIKAYAEKLLGNKDLKPVLNIDAELKFSDIDDVLLKDLKRLEPHGQGNPKPKFVSRSLLVVDILTMGLEAQHIKFKLKSDDNLIFSAIGFNQTEKWDKIGLGDKIDIVYYLDENNFNGRIEIQFKIIDIYHHKDT